MHLCDFEEWGETEILSIPSGMHLAVIGNREARGHNTLSIPSGMHRQALFSPWTQVLGFFQSLLGCITSDVVALFVDKYTFNPFWDASIPTLCEKRKVTKKLSIPSGMHPAPGVTWGICTQEAFNPFWDASLYGGQCLRGRVLTFNPFLDASSS